MGARKMIKKFKASGTVLCGRAMMAQLASEMVLLKVENPVIVAQDGFKKEAKKAALMFNSGIYESISVVEGDAPAENDFVIMAGGKPLTHFFADDNRYKAWVPLNNSHLQEIGEPVSDFLVIDRAFIKNKTILKNFFEKYANSITEGLIRPLPNINIPPSFTYSCRTSVLIGDTTLEKLPELLDVNSIRRPLLLTDKGIISVGLLKFVTTQIDHYNPVIFSDIPADSNINVVNEISSLYRENECDAIIAFGGGSVLDTGKGVYLNVSLNNSDLLTMVGSGHIPRLKVPFYTIPTTSGTGSEVTKVAVISDPDRGRKLLFNSTNLQPDYALLDSRLTTSLPPHLTSITGVDALTHAVEAYTCLGKNPLSDYMAWTAIELIRDHLVPAVSDPGNLEHRKALALASNLAGQAFSNSMVGMVHSIGHSIGSVCHAPHGSCMSVLLPHALEFNCHAIKPFLGELLQAVAGKVIFDETAEDERPGRMISEIRTLNRILKEKTEGRHPEKLSDIKNREGENLINKEDFQKIAETSMGDASIVYNPVELRVEDVMGVLERSY
jgi:alcohol dehydrogenase